MKNTFLTTKDDEISPPRIGEIINGKIVGIDRSSIFIDLGPTGTGIIFGKEFQEAKNILKDAKMGDSISAKIINLENEDGYIELSASEANREINWKKLRDIKEKEEVIKVKITGANKGGLLTDVFGIPAFLPVSQLSSQHYPHIEGEDRSQIVRELQKFISQEIEAKIINLDLNEERLVLSEKAGEIESTKEYLKNYKIGDIIEGEITKITDFGAFIKFPAVENKTEKYLEGLCHISELDWQIVKHPSEIVKIGEKIKTKIVNIADNKIFLSLKALKKDPWQNIEKEYKKGDSIKGKIVKLNNFGAFVQIEKAKIQGLCHISEFGTKEKMEEKIKIEKEYKFKILSLDSKEHKMTLSLIT